MNIIQSINDEHIFQPFLGDLSSWKNWMVALRLLYGLPQRRSSRHLIKQCTGRSNCQQKEGFSAALFLSGRRSGKSRVSAVIAAYEAVLAGREKALAKGEKGIVLVASPTRNQSKIVHSYIRAIFETPLLANELVKEYASHSNQGFELKSGVRIEILAGDWRTVRGFSLICAVVDEVCFFGYDAESKVKSDTELIRAIKPSLATTGGKLVCISSPYAEKGWAFKTYKRSFGNDEATTLVWNCSSRTMNPTLPQSIVDEALAEDNAAARAEYLGEFRTDVVTFLPRDVIEACVIKGRQELPPQSKAYHAFVDISGGRSDDAALAIAHRERDKIVIDKIERFKPPFSPDTVIGKMVETLNRYRIGRATGDNYSAEFCKQAFETRGIKYGRSTTNPWADDVRAKTAKPKSQLYLEMLPRLCSGEIELLDHALLVDQIASLERRTRVGGRDTVDHGPLGHDDIANAVAGVVDLCSKPVTQAGAMSSNQSSNRSGFSARTYGNRRSWSQGIHPTEGVPING